MVAIATLALAIGANAIVFAVLNALILRPVNVPEAQSLWSIQRGSQKAINHSYPDYLDLRDRNRSFEGLAAYDLAPAGLDTGGDPASAWIMEATGNYFDVLKVHPYLGRFFHAADEHGPNSAPYIVLTYAYWHSHFQDDRSVVGRVVQLNKHPFTILGVAPPEFRGTLLFVFPDFWVPLVNQEQVEGVDVRNERGNHFLLMMLGHLKPGVTPAQAVSDLNSIGASLEKTYPKDDAQMTFSLTRPGLAGDWLGGPLQAFLSGLMLLAALILLAACANLGSLFAARAADRSREVALRLSLGASRGRILRQLFTEAILISLIGGAAGLWGSILLLRALSVWHPMPTAPLQIPIHADWHVYAVAVLLSLASGFLFGAVPVTQVLRTDAYQVIKSGPAATAWRRLTARDLLLVAQIAICAVLVTASLVAVRGLMRSLHSNFGFEPQNAMLVETSLSMAGYKGEQIPLMQKRMIEALEKIPGVTEVGSVDRLPLYYGANFANVFTDQTADLNPANAAASAATYNISPGYFDAAGTILLSGRRLSWHDDKNAPRVAVVNREFARRVLGSVPDGLGRYFKLRDGSRVQVVGLVEDGKVRNSGRRDSSGHVPAHHPGASVERSDAGGALESRPAAGCGCRIECGTRAGRRSSLHHPNLEARVGRRTLPLPDGDPGSRRFRHHGRGAVDHRHLRISRVFDQQAATRAGNPYRAGGKTSGSLTGSVGAAIQTAAVRLGGGTDTRRVGQPSARLHRLSGDSTRSPGVRGCCACHGAAWTGRHVDPGATRAERRSANIAARGMKLDQRPRVSFGWFQ